MTKKLITSVLLISSLALTACGIKNIVKTETPEQVIKDLQVNLVDSFKETALSKQNAEWTSNINIDVKTPMWGGNLSVSMDSKWVGSTWEANLDLNGNFNVNAWQVLSWDISWKIDLISTLDKLYVNLKDFNLKTSNPQLAMYNSIVSMMKGKWFYIPTKSETKQLSKALQSISIKDELSKYNVFKVNKKLWDYKYDVSIDKKNLATIIVDVSKQLDKNYTWTVSQVEKQLDWDVTWILSIEDNKKYFTFSGNLVFADGSKVPVSVKYTEKKLYLNVNKSAFVLDLNKDWDSFDGFASFKDAQSNEFKLKINAKLTEDTIEIRLAFNENNINVVVDANGKFKDIDKVNIEIPKDAVSIQELQSQLWWGR